MDLGEFLRIPFGLIDEWNGAEIPLESVGENWGVGAEEGDGMLRLIGVELRGWAKELGDWSCWSTDVDFVWRKIDFGQENWELVSVLLKRNKKI